ncbi:MAG: hypothetical protein WCI27_00990 [Candidatus Omnitrophota bacterium]
MMQRLIFAALLVGALTTSSFALGVVDSMSCKRVQLHEANDRTVLVKRITGEVKYALQYNGNWVPVSGDQKERYQSMYNAQVKAAAMKH